MFFVDALEDARGRDQERRVFTFLGADGRVERVLTVCDLVTRAGRIATALKAHAAPGDRVVLMLSPGADYVCAFLGCLFAGVLAVPAFPVDPARAGRTGQRLRAIIADATPTFALVDGGSGGAQAASLGLRWLDASSIADDASFDAPVPTASSFSGTDVAYIQYTSGSTASPRGVVVTFDNVLRNLRAFRDAAGYGPGSVKVSWLPPFHDAGLVDGLLQPIFSGAHAVMMAPRTFVADPYRWLEAITRFGGTHGGAPNFAFDLCVRKIDDVRLATLDLSSLRVLYNAAEPVRASTIRRFVERFSLVGLRPDVLMPCYGLAEATLLVTGSTARRAPTVRRVGLATLASGEAAACELRRDTRSVELVGCGNAVDTTVAIVDPDTRAPARALTVGEIWLKGPSVTAGYWGRPEETREVFGAHDTEGEGPFLRTGDLGFVDASGELFVTGRRKDLVIVGGENFYPQDIELAAEESHPAVRAGCSAAFAVENGDAERLAIVCEVERRSVARSSDASAAPERDRRRPADPEVDAFTGAASGGLVVDDVVASIRASIASAVGLTVHRVVLVKPGTLPKTSSGKIMRGACRAIVLSGTADMIASWTAPSFASDDHEPASGVVDAARPVARDEIRTWLVGWCCQRLGLAEWHIDPRKPFASYGLDSPGAVALASAIGRWLGREVPVGLAFDYPSIEAMAAALSHVPSHRPPRGGWESETKSRVRRRADAQVASMTDDEVIAALDGRARSRR